MKEKLLEMYNYLKENHETFDFDESTTFEQFVQDTIEAYWIDNVNCKSFDEFVDYEYSQMYNW